MKLLLLACLAAGCLAIVWVPGRDGEVPVSMPGACVGHVVAIVAMPWSAVVCHVTGLPK